MLIGSKPLAELFSSASKSVVIPLEMAGINSAIPPEIRERVGLEKLQKTAAARGVGAAFVGRRMYHGVLCYQTGEWLLNVDKLEVYLSRLASGTALNIALVLLESRYEQWNIGLARAAAICAARVTVYGGPPLVTFQTMAAHENSQTT